MIVTSAQACHTYELWAKPLRGPDRWPSSAVAVLLVNNGLLAELVWESDDVRSSLENVHIDPSAVRAYLEANVDGTSRYVRRFLACDDSWRVACRVWREASSAGRGRPGSPHALRLTFSLFLPLFFSLSLPFRAARPV